MRSVTHCLRYSSLKCSKQTFTVRSAIVNSFTSSVFPSEANGKTEKNSLSCGRFHSLLVAFRNSKTRRHSEIKQTSPSTKQDFSGEALSKQNTEASLASLSWLVPGDDRVVRHICIRCIEHSYIHAIVLTHRLFITMFCRQHGMFPKSTSSFLLVRYFSFINPLTPVPPITARDKAWPFFLFWRHRFWPKLASSILNFCRRRRSFQWCPDQSDWPNGALDKC